MDGDRYILRHLSAVAIGDCYAEYFVMRLVCSQSLYIICAIVQSIRVTAVSLYYHIAVDAMERLAHVASFAFDRDYRVHIACIKICRVVRDYIACCYSAGRIFRNVSGNGCHDRCVVRAVYRYR